MFSLHCYCFRETKLHGQLRFALHSVTTIHSRDGLRLIEKISLQINNYYQDVEIAGAECPDFIPCQPRQQLQQLPGMLFLVMMVILVIIAVTTLLVMNILLNLIVSPMLFSPVPASSPIDDDDVNEKQPRQSKLHRDIQLLGFLVASGSFSLCPPFVGLLASCKPSDIKHYITRKRKQFIIV